MILAWTSFLAIGGGLILFSFLVVKFYSDPTQERCVSIIISTLTLSVAIITLLLIPVDIYNVSRDAAPPGSISGHGQVIQLVYYGLFSILVACVFLLVPFVLFYHEVGTNDDHMTTGDRMCLACKYTTLVLCILLILVGTGIFAAPSPHQKKEQWYQHLMSTMDHWDRCLAFLMGCIATAGLLSWLSYTAVGLAIVPVQLLFASDRSGISMSTKQQAVMSLEMLKEKIRVIEVKYQLSGRPITPKDKAELEELRGHSNHTANQITQMEQSTETCGAMCFRILTPFRLLFGVIAAVSSSAVVVSFSISNLDRLLNSDCGAECGFAIARATMFNPVDEFFVAVSKWFPMDYVAMSLLVVYLVMCTFEGISCLGLRFLWMQMFTFKRRATDPAAILLGVCVIATMILTVIVEMLTILPQYATFGSKEVAGSQCELGAEGCHMSEISKLVHRIIAMNYFSFIFFYGTWFFVVVFLVALFLSIAFRPREDYVHPEAAHQIGI